MEEHNGIKFGIFGIIVLVIIVGGFILMQKSFEKNDKPKENTTEQETKKDIRLDKDKDYIYFSDYEVYEEELDITFSKVNINFKDSNNIAKTLNDENASFKAGIKKENDDEEAPYDKLSYAKYSKYDLYAFGDYISLLVKYYTFTPDSFISFVGCKSYVFNINDGSLVTNESLMKKYGLTPTIINNKISDYVSGQDLLKDEEKLDVAGTLSVNKEYVFFVDRVGRLNASILVKSDKKDYNDNVILN